MFLYSRCPESGSVRGGVPGEKRQRLAGGITAADNDLLFLAQVGPGQLRHIDARPRRSALHVSRR